MPKHREASTNKATKKQATQFSDFERDYTPKAAPKRGKVQVVNNKKRTPNMDR